MSYRDPKFRYCPGASHANARAFGDRQKRRMAAAQKARDAALEHAGGTAAAPVVGIFRKRGA